MGKQKNKLPDKHAKLVQNFNPRTDKQRELVELINLYEVILATGPAGTGKTYTALAAALNLLSTGYKKIILVKSVTTIPGEEIGFLKGSVDQKMEPFIMSYTWNIDKICGEFSAQKLLDSKIVEVLPLAFIRGLSIDDSIVIIDEAQNIDAHTFKTIMTRIGDNSKYIFLGDTEQIDRKKKNESCLSTVMDIFKQSDIVGTIEFTDNDCVRNPIIPIILSQLRERGI